VKSDKKDDGFVTSVISAVYVDDIIPVSDDVAKSTTEAEYVAMSSNTRSNIHKNKLLADLDYKAGLSTVPY